MDLINYLEERKKIVEEALDKYLPPEESYPQTLYKSMRYSIYAGGKRLRPILTMASAEIFNKDISNFIPTACALEMIHTYSLIHDDLPAMDDDDYRRGKSTNHKVFGEAIAVLAGDALLTQAFEILSRDLTGESQKIKLNVIEEISKASGTNGMIGGQVVDLESEGKDVNADILKYIHTHKTGALIKASVRVGGIIGEATEEELAALTEYAKNLGLAFQIKDDLLDIEGEAEKIGKKTGKDSIQKKATYPAIFGIKGAREKTQELYKESLRCIETLGDRGYILKLIAEFLVDRDY